MRAAGLALHEWRDAFYFKSNKPSHTTPSPLCLHSLDEPSQNAVMLTSVPPGRLHPLTAPVPPHMSLYNCMHAGVHTK